MFTRSQEFYDLLYEASGKDYQEEVVALRAMLERLGGIPSNSEMQPRLLDVACGTGRHLELLDEFCRVGVDIEPQMLAIAMKRCPDALLREGDMRTLNCSQLGGEFDVVSCLFSAIAYMADVQELHKAISSMKACLKPGGLLLIESFLEPQEIEEGRISALHVDKPGVKVSRMNVTRVQGNRMLLDFHYLVAEDSGVSYFTEAHELTLFTRDEYAGVFAENGLEWSFDAHGLCGRGMHIGRC